MLGQTKRNPKVGSVLSLHPDEIFPNPNQPRQHFDSNELAGLAESIRQNGILQPLTVRSLPSGGYELIAGERRLRASRIAGLPTVPCILSDVSDEKSAILALVENLQRQDLDYFEEAEAIQRMMSMYGIPQEQMARTLGKAPSTLSNKLRLLRLAPELRSQISAAGLTERHARAILRLENPEQRQHALQTIITRELNVGDTDKLVDALLSVPQKEQGHATIRLVRDVRLFLNTINHAIDTMRRAGITADSTKAETDDYIVYTVRIPKSEAQKSAEPRVNTA